jgi:hypothetical protein
MPDLDAHLDAAREDLLRHIQAPGMDGIRRRATRIRRRRLGTAAGAMAVVAVLTVGVSIVDSSTRPPVAPAASTPAPNGPFWRDGSLTLIGLGPNARQMPGDLHDIQFADADDGYALSADCQGAQCRLGFATTRDGGRTWRVAPPPGPTPVPVTALPTLVTVQGGVLAVGRSAWLSQGGSWREVGLPARPPDTDAVPPGGRLWLRTSDRDGCVPAAVETWSPAGVLTRLAHQPALQVCRVVPAPGRRGTWWVGGHVSTSEGRAPAVGRSADGGRTWTVTRLPGTGTDAWAQVTTLGADVIATVVSPGGGDPFPEKLRIDAVYRSASGGPFVRRAAVEGTLVGDAMWRLDDGLVVAGPRWYVSAAPGEPLRPAGESMPFVRRLARTPGAWVAYDLFGSGFAAVSTDGRSWHKINIY